MSALETALRIRKEELQYMGERADALERRIIDGVMDHSRALLMMKSARTKPNMDLKRVSSSSSRDTVSTTTQATVATAGVNLALKSRLNARHEPTSSAPATRRIMSLGPITSNVPTGGLASTGDSGPRGWTGLKRKQQNRNQLRKSTWAAGQTDIPAYDQENSVLEDGSDDETDTATVNTSNSRVQSYDNSRLSGAGRVSSFGTVAPSESSYVSSSYLTRTDSDRRTSYESTIRSNMESNQHYEESVDGSEDDEDAEEESEGGGQEEEGEGGGKLGEVADTVEGDEADEDVDSLAELEASVRPQHEEHAVMNMRKVLALQGSEVYDSGLGTDLPTAALFDATGGGSYFRMIKGHHGEEEPELA